MKLTSKAKAFWIDDQGFIISAELVIIATILVLGLIVGLSSVQSAIVGELSDVSRSFCMLNQNFFFRGFRGCKSWTASSANFSSHQVFTCACQGAFDNFDSIGVGAGFGSGFVGGGAVFGGGGGSATFVAPAPSTTVVTPAAPQMGPELCPPGASTTCPPAATNDCPTNDCHSAPSAIPNGVTPVLPKGTSVEPPAPVMPAPGPAKK